MKNYEGPAIKAFDVEMEYSDSARLVVYMTAPLQLEYENGDQDFPKGIKVIFHNRQGQKQTELTANKAKHFKQDNRWVATGNVIVKNLLKNEQLNTEELIWTPNSQTIYTEKFVTVTTDTEILKGNGLKARQDFTGYRVSNPTGRFTIKK